MVQAPTIRQVAGAANKANHKYRALYLEIMNKTSFLNPSASFGLRWWYWQNNLNSSVLCQCGCNKPLKHPQKTKYLQGHSNSAEEVKQNKINSLQQKYNRTDITNISQLEEVKQKKEEVFKQKYGTTSPLDRKIVEPIWLEKYGVNNPSKLDWVKEKLSVAHTELQNSLRMKERKAQTQKTNFYKSLLNHPKWKPLFALEEYKGANKGHFYEFECRACNNIRRNELNEGTNFRCYTCNPRIDSGGQSKIENEIETYCKALFVDVEVQNRQIIPPFEIDLYIPSKRIAIEHHGLYWHSEQNKSSRFYHKKKTELCQEQNIRLIQIFEDEWRDKKQIVKSRLRHICGLTKYKIFGRKCKIKQIDDGNLKKKFLDKYHIQGNDKSHVQYGLFYKNKLVSLMTFGPLRSALGNKTTQENVWELVRYCTVSNFAVIGGAHKLLKHFIKMHCPLKVITYADARWSIGNLYEQIGFKKIGMTLPNYFYVVNNKRVHRFSYQKHTLKDKLKRFDPNLSETENMKNNGYYRIWDCGHYKFEITF